MTPRTGIADEQFEHFKDIHVGHPIIVCGCGRSLRELEEPNRFVTIGVNDVGRLFQPTYLLVLNPPEQFWGDRFHYVETSKADTLFSQLDLPVQHPRKVQFPLGTFEGISFREGSGIHYTKNSPYAAICLAVHMGAKLIGMIGVDFTDDHFFARTGTHQLTSDLPTIERQYFRLHSALRQRGIEIYNLSTTSRITTVPKISLAEFQQRSRIASCTTGIEQHQKTETSSTQTGLRIVSYATTPIAGVPAVLARCINKMTPHSCRCVWQYLAYSNGVSFLGDIQWSEQPSEAIRVLSEADLVIVHNGKVDARHRNLLNGKPVITMAHNYMWNVDNGFVKRGLPGVVVGQYQATLSEFRGWSMIPNPMPLWEEHYLPDAKPPVPTIAYTPSGHHDAYPTTHRLYWHSKGYTPTLRILEALAKRYTIRLELVRERGVSHVESMAMKRRAHIVIDECVTGSYHRNSLEGLATGCVVVNGLGKRPSITEIFRTCSGNDEIPFETASLNNLEDILAGLIETGTEALAQRGAANRRWMEAHWDFRCQWSRFWEPVVAQALAASPERVSNI